MPLVLVFLLHFLQLLPGLPDPDAVIAVGGEVEGPYIFREDLGQTTKVILKNGLRVIVRENNAIPLSSVTMLIEAGLADEPSGESGVSRVVAELAVSGTSDPDTGDAERRIRTLGGILNSETGYDHTIFELVAGADEIVAAMAVQKTAVWDAIPDPVGLARAIDLVGVDDAVLGADSAVRARDRLRAIAFDTHPFGRSRFAVTSQLRGLTVEAVRRFRAAHYRPSNAILAVVGQFERERMLAEIVRVYGDLAAFDTAAEVDGTDGDDASGDDASGDDAPGDDASGDDASEAAVTLEPAGEGIPPVAVETIAGTDTDSTAPDAEASAEPSAEPATGLRPAPPEQTQLRYDWQTGPIERLQIAMGFQVPGWDGPDDDVFSIEVLARILATGRASRFNTYLRDEEGVITGAEFEYLRFDGSGFLTFAVEADDATAAEVAVLREMERIRRFGVTAEELDRARVSVAREYYQRRETVDGIGREIVHYEAAGDWKLMRFFLDGLDAVTAADIQRVTTTYLGTGSLTVFEYLPAASDRFLTTPDFQTLVVDPLQVNMVQRSVALQPVDARVPPLGDELIVDVIPPMVRRSILRGPDVYIMEDHRLPLVSFGIFYPGGRLYESEANAGITELMLRTALRGTLRFNSGDIARRLENAGAGLTIVNEPDFFGYVLDGVSGEVDEALGVLVEVLQEPTFPEDALEQEKAVLASDRDRLSEDHRRVRADRFLEAVFGDDAYGRRGEGRPDALESVVPDDLDAWHDEHLRGLVPVIVIAGDTQGTGLVASIAEALTNEDLIERDILDLPGPDVVLEREHLVLTPDWEHAAVILGTPTTRYDHEDRLHLVTLGQLLDQRVRSLPFPSRRTRVDSRSMARGGSIWVEAIARPEDAVVVRELIEAEMLRLGEERVEAAELESAIRRAIRAREVESQSRHDRVLGLARVLTAGGEASAVEAYADLFDAVDPDQIRATAARYLNPLSATSITFSPER